MAQAEEPIAWGSERTTEWLNTLELPRDVVASLSKVTGHDLTLPRLSALGCPAEHAEAIVAAFQKLSHEDRPAAMAVDEPKRLPAMASGDFICHICMDVWFEPVTTACGHSFCQSCLTAWLAKSNSCPVDRKELPRAVPAVNLTLSQVTERSFPEQTAARRTAVATADGKAAEELEKARVAAELHARRAKVEALQRHFRGNVALDDAACEAVLAVVDGDVQAAIGFLELQGEPPADFVDVRNVGTGAGGVPPDYMRLPPLASLPPLPAAAPPGPLSGLLRCFTDTEATLAEHMQQQTVNGPRYRAVLQLCVSRGIDLAPVAKARVLAACWARHDHAFAASLLGGAGQGILDVHEGRADVFGLIDILRAVRLLDTGRVVRVKQRKLAELRARANVRAGTIQRAVTEIEELQRDVVPGCSLSGALAGHIRRVIAAIPAAKLEFFALQMPAEPWRELCDLLHVHPTSGTAVPWFLPRCFGTPAPEDSVVAACAAATEENVQELITRFRPPYSFLRLKYPDLPAACRPLVARYAPLDQCLWYYEDLHCPGFDAILLERLRAGEVPSLPYGKLMERLMVLRATAGAAPPGELFAALLALAETRLQGMRLSLAPPVVVMGDASYSMDVAIRVSVIMASVLAVLTHAELRFFNTVSFAPAVVPHTAAEVLTVAADTRADGPTAPACALLEYYNARRPVNTFVVVTDERENTKSHDTYFPMLFRRYVTEVHPARLVLVSFLEHNATGQMAAALVALGIQPVQFTLDGRRPDLTRLDGLLGLLATGTDAFEGEVDAELKHMAAQPPAQPLAPLPSRPKGPKAKAAKGAKDAKDGKDGKAPAPGPAVDAAEVMAFVDAAAAASAAASAAGASASMDSSE